MPKDNYQPPSIDVIPANTLSSTMSYMTSGGSSGGSSGNNGGSGNGGNNGGTTGGNSGSGSGDDDATTVLPTMHWVLANNFAFGETPENGQLNDSDGEAAGIFLEIYWDEICNFYSAESGVYRSWVFFKTLGSLCYGDENKVSDNGILSTIEWQAVAGSFTNFETFYTVALGLDSNTERFIENAVQAGHKRSSDKTLDFAHLCITAATHLATYQNLSTAKLLSYLINLIADFASCGFTEGSFLNAAAGWLGDAASESSSVEAGDMNLADSNSDLDAVIATEGYIIGASHNAKTFFQNYYLPNKPDESQRISSFLQNCTLSTKQILAAISCVTCLQDDNIDPSFMNRSQAEQLLYFKVEYPNIYDNFLSRLGLLV